MSTSIYQLTPTEIMGCFQLQPMIRSDSRGRLVKTFHQEAFNELGLATVFKEDFYSVSRQGVLRGLHFQSPPHGQTKLVYCLDGIIQDVALDIRSGSPTFGKHVMLNLSAEEGNMLYLPSGLAHGFYTLSSSATVGYKCSEAYEPGSEGGVLWSSAGIEWANQKPQLSERDQTFPRLDELNTPFFLESDD